MNNKNRREMLQGFSQFLQEDEVTHVVSPYMTVHFNLTAQHGVELRNTFVRRRIFFEKLPSQNIQGCHPSFQPPKKPTQDPF